MPAAAQNDLAQPPSATQPCSRLYLNRSSPAVEKPQYYVMGLQVICAPLTGVVTPADPGLGSDLLHFSLLWRLRDAPNGNKGPSKCTARASYTTPLHSSSISSCLLRPWSLSKMSAADVFELRMETTRGRFHPDLVAPRK